jgi:tetratricopeptide (TPR) repeat protein
MQKPLMWMSLVFIVVAALAARPTPAFADGDDDEAAAAAAALAKPTDPEALRYLEKGDAFFRLREFEDAIDAYRQGARIQASPRFLYNLAQSFRQLDDYENALWYFKQWINTAKPPDSMRLPIEAIMGKMRDDLAKAATTQPPTELAGEGGAGTDKTGNGGPEAGITTSGPPWYADKLGWGLTAGGVLGAATGLLFLMNASSLDDDANASTDGELVREALRDKASTRRGIGTVLLGLGGAVAVTGVVRLILTPAGVRAETPATRSDAVNVSVGFGWIGVQGHF